MAGKESGIGWTTASRDDSADSLKAIVNCVLNIDFSITRGVQDVTGLDKSAMERLLLLGDYSSTWLMAFNDCSGKSFDVHKTVASADAVRDEKLTISAQKLDTKVLLTGMDLARAADGSFTISGPAVLQDGTDPTWTT